MLFVKNLFAITIVGGRLLRERRQADPERMTEGKHRIAWPEWRTRGSPKLMG